MPRLFFLNCLNRLAQSRKFSPSTNWELNLPICGTVYGKSSLEFNPILYSHVHFSNAELHILNFVMFLLLISLEKLYLKC